MTQRAYLYAILLLAVLAALAWLWWPRTPAVVRASLVAAAAPADASGFVRAEGPQPLTFPADHGPHDDYQTEWWYFTGNLTATTGEQFGYQLTFFRRALVPPAARAGRPSAWGTEQVYLAHFALTDVAGREHRSFERLARGAAGLAGAQAEPFRVWLEDWEVSTPGAAEATANPTKPTGAGRAMPALQRLRAAVLDPDPNLSLSVDLTLSDLKPPALQGDRGYSRKGPEPGNASFYYSRTRIASGGTVTVRGRAFAVSGLSWMDHEWSTSALGPEQVGWDWFSIQLDDETELMAFQLRRADGSPDPFSSGTLIAADGSTRRLDDGDFALQVTGRWRSPTTGGDYPAGWVLTVPSADLRLTITPLLADQEMRVSYTYWEGAVRVEGTSGGKTVTGKGYVELTGYAGSMQGQF